MPRPLVESDILLCLSAGPQHFRDLCRDIWMADNHAGDRAVKATLRRMRELGEVDYALGLSRWHLTPKGVEAAEQVPEELP